MPWYETFEFHLRAEHYCFGSVANGNVHIPVLEAALDGRFVSPIVSVIVASTVDIVTSASTVSSLSLMGKQVRNSCTKHFEYKSFMHLMSDLTGVI